MKTERVGFDVLLLIPRVSCDGLNKRLKCNAYFLGNLLGLFVAYNSK